MVPQLECFWSCPIYASLLCPVLFCSVQCGASCRSSCVDRFCWSMRLLNASLISLQSKKIVYVCCFLLPSIIHNVPVLLCIYELYIFKYSFKIYILIYNLGFDSLVCVMTRELQIIDAIFFSESNCIQTFMRYPWHGHGLQHWFHGTKLRYLSLKKTCKIKIAVSISIRISTKMIPHCVCRELIKKIHK
jgi:hypothetical protein